ncbi:hypothetical protein ACQEU3_42765 [Spirillospora sp. CA-253888]
MITSTGRPVATRARRPTAMYAGLALSALAALAPLVDIATADTLSAHVRAAYPGWRPDQVAADRNAIAGYLAVTGALGVLLWLVAIRAVVTGRRWARTFATAALVAGVLVALTNLGMGGERYDVIVPYAYGTLTLLPCAAGLAAVVSIWRHGRPTPRE